MLDQLASLADELPPLRRNYRDRERLLVDQVEGRVTWHSADEPFFRELVKNASDQVESDAIPGTQARRGPSKPRILDERV